MGEYGRPLWREANHFLRQEFPDIEILIQSTHDAAISHPEWRIDYLHVDADHSYEGIYRDFLDYVGLMNRPAVITFHDTAEGLHGAKIAALLKQQGYSIINFKDLGCGFAVLYLD